MLRGIWRACNASHCTRRYAPDECYYYVALLRMCVSLRHLRPRPSSPRRTLPRRSLVTLPSEAYSLPLAAVLPGDALPTTCRKTKSTIRLVISSVIMWPLCINGVAAALSSCTETEICESWDDSRLGLDKDLDVALVHALKLVRQACGATLHVRDKRVLFTGEHEQLLPFCPGRQRSLVRCVVRFGQCHEARWNGRRSELELVACLSSCVASARRRLGDERLEVRRQRAGAVREKREVVGRADDRDACAESWIVCEREPRRVSSQLCADKKRSLKSACKLKGAQRQ